MRANATRLHKSLSIISISRDIPGISSDLTDGFDDVMISTKDFDALHGTETVTLAGAEGKHRMWSQWRGHHSDEAEIGF